MKYKKYNPCTYLTRCWWSMEVNFFTVLSEPGLVAASHPEHIHTVHLQSINHSTGPSHFIHTLPCCCGIRGSGAAPGRSSSSCSSLVFNREVPCWGRVLREAPAQKQLVISECLLCVNNWSQRGCGGDKATEWCRLHLFTLVKYNFTSTWFISQKQRAYHVWTPSCGWAWPLWMRLGENVWRRDQQREWSTGGSLWPSPAWKKEEKLNKEMSSLPRLGFGWISVSPAVSDSGSLYEAGCIGLLEQLLCVGHQTRMLQQASPLWDLSRQGLLLPAAGSLQGQSQSPLTLCYSRTQLSDTVGQLLQSHWAVRLERDIDGTPKSGENWRKKWKNTDRLGMTKRHCLCFYQPQTSRGPTNTACPFSFSCRLRLT